jgi:NADPH-dependent glutamate synthase beta subunit-like oxidoreductase
VISDINIKVDRDLCYACGLCVERCVLDNLRLFVAPCRVACPIHMNCQGYARLIAQGKEREAAEEMRSGTPFGGILGRVCTHPCEPSCERGKTDGAVHIRALKRYLAESYPEIAYMPGQVALETRRKVVVVGSGPAGLMAAYELRARGHEVRVIEKKAEPGGLLRHGLPGFRLPPSEVSAAVDLLERMGVRFRTSETVGQGLEWDRVLEEYDAAVLAVGLGRPLDLDLPGRGLPNVITGLGFLEQIRAGNRPKPGRAVVVIGGGNTAVDAALTCRRLGAAAVRLVCVEPRGEMPAFPSEIAEAIEEGVIIENGWGPLGITPRRGGLRVNFGRCLALRDKSGNFRPQLAPETGLSLKANTIVLALGQTLEPEGLSSELMEKRGLSLAVDPLTFQSPKEPRLFACGDAATGPVSVVHAFASGQEAAISVDRFLRGEGLRWGRDARMDGWQQESTADFGTARGGRRGPLPRLDVEKRDLVKEVEGSLSPKAARIEAERCLSCGRAAEVNLTCWYCLPCEIECPTKALTVRMPYLVR